MPARHWPDMIFLGLHFTRTGCAFSYFPISVMLKLVVQIKYAVRTLGVQNGHTPVWLIQTATPLSG